jgi:hypothetical protein
MIKRLESSMWTNQHLSVVMETELKNNVLTDEEVAMLMVSGFGEFKKVPKPSSPKQSPYFIKRVVLLTEALGKYLVSDIELPQKDTHIIRLREELDEYQSFKKKFKTDSTLSLSTRIIIEPESLIKEIFSTKQINIFFKEVNPKVPDELEMKFKKIILLNDIEETIEDRKEIRERVNDVAKEYEEKVISIYKKMIGSVIPLKLTKEERQLNLELGLQMIMIRRYGLSEVFFQNTKRERIVKPASLAVYEKSIESQSGVSSSKRPSQLIKGLVDKELTIKDILYGINKNNPFEKSKKAHKEEIEDILNNIREQITKVIKREPGGQF